MIILVLPNETLYACKKKKKKKKKNYVYRQLIMNGSNRIADRLIFLQLFNNFSPRDLKKNNVERNDGILIFRVSFTLFEFYVKYGIVILDPKTERGSSMSGIVFSFFFFPLPVFLW